MDLSKLDRDAEMLVKAANTLRSQIAELKSENEAMSARNDLNSRDDTIRISYRK